MLNHLMHRKAHAPYKFCLIALILISTHVTAEHLPVKIGIIAPLTGVGAIRGQSAREGLELATERIIQSGVLKKGDFELIYQDAPLNKASQAALAARHLIDVEQVTAIIGPMGSSACGAAAPIIDRARIPTITHTNSSPTALAGTSFLFRLWPTGRGYADIIVKELLRLNYRRIAIFTATHDSPLDVRSFLKEELRTRKNSPLEIVFDEEFAVEDTDFRSVLLKASSRKPDILFLNLFEGQIGAVARQARGLGLKMDFVTNAIMSDVELAVAPKELDGIWFPRFLGYTQAGKNSFIKKFGREPFNTESAAAAHDALLVLAEAIAVHGTKTSNIRTYLKEAKSFSGVTGAFNFQENGDANVPIALYVVQRGAINKKE
jgi:branched-chain amino acid transport system substrate-binding protein